MKTVVNISMSQALGKTSTYAVLLYLCSSCYYSHATDDKGEKLRQTCS